MFFWTRALLCIGTVTAMAIGHLPDTPVPSHLPDLAQPAAALVGEACRAKPEFCAAAVTGGFDAAMHAVGDRPADSARAPHRRSHRGEPVALGQRSLT